ncbi:hypothetical protein E2C01_100954 [Portunus trituberculatus]|uniref:Uncharacterized protein n=1 Tax=Portunus trituberculatus TaxID=210409 RepID=A0A5B7K9D1_PORTR|nr:hypothetical protein [Portunus trituberculatus]
MLCPSPFTHFPPLTLAMSLHPTSIHYPASPYCFTTSSYHWPVTRPSSYYQCCLSYRHNRCLLYSS